MMMRDEESFEVEYCRYPLIDITYLLSVIAMMLALYSAFAPDFYTYSDEEDVTGERYVCVFTSMFYETDEVTSAAFAFLVSAWLFSACGGGVISERYQEGYGDHDELLPGISCCLSVWYSLVGTLGLLSLIALSSDTCTGADACKLSYGGLTVIVASFLWFVCAILMCATSCISRWSVAKVYCTDGQEGGQHAHA